MINVEHARKIIADINGSNINTASKGDALRNMTFTLTGEEICTLLQEIERLRTEQTPFRNAPNPTDWRQPPMPPHQGMYQPQPQDQGIHSGQTPPQVHPAPLRLHECDPYILPQINGPYNDHTKKTAVSLVLNELNSSPRYLRPDANRAMLLELIRDDGNNDDFIELIEVVLYKPGETSPAPGPNPLDVAAIVGSKLSAMVLTKGGTLPMPQVQWAKYYTDAAKKMERTPQGAGDKSTQEGTRFHSDEIKNTLIRWAGWSFEDLTEAQKQMLRPISDDLAASLGGIGLLTKSVFLNLKPADFGQPIKMNPDAINIILALQRDVKSKS